MQVKKEGEIILLIVFLILFFSVGSYIGIKDMNGAKVIDIKTHYIWDVANGVIKENGIKEEESKEAIEEMPIEIPEEEANLRIIDIKNTKFDPRELDISVGTTVHWVNQDPKRNYQIYERSAKQLFNSGQLQPYESFDYTFNEPGVYYYNDAIFTYMSGIIRVK